MPESPTVYQRDILAELRNTQHDTLESTHTNYFRWLFRKTLFAAAFPASKELISKTLSLDSHPMQFVQDATTREWKLEWKEFYFQATTGYWISASSRVFKDAVLSGDFVSSDPLYKEKLELENASRRDYTTKTGGSNRIKQFKTYARDMESTTRQSDGFNEELTQELMLNPLRLKQLKSKFKTALEFVLSHTTARSQTPRRRAHSGIVPMSRY